MFSSGVPIETRRRPGHPSEAPSRTITPRRRSCSWTPGEPAAGSSGAHQDEVALAGGEGPARLRERPLHAGALGDRLAHAALQGGRVAQALEGGGLREGVGVERLAHPVEGVDPAGRPHPVADPQPAEAVGLAERPRHQQVGPLAGQGHRAAGVGPVDELEVGLVHQHGQVLGQRVEEALDLVGAAVRARGVVRVAHEHQAGALVHRRRHGVEVVAVVGRQRHRDALGARGRRQVRVEGEGRRRVDDARARVEQGLPRQQDQLARAVAQHDLVRPHGVALGQRAAQRPPGPVGVAVEPGDARGHDVGHLRQRREGALVRRELHRAVEAEARQHLGRREAGLVARDGAEAG